MTNAEMFEIVFGVDWFKVSESYTWDHQEYKPQSYLSNADNGMEWRQIIEVGKPYWIECSCCGFRLFVTKKLTKKFDGFPNKCPFCGAVRDIGNDSKPKAEKYLDKIREC